MSWSRLATRRLIMRKVVDLPAAERPMMPTNCPGGTVSEISATATDLPNRFVTPSRTSTRPPARFGVCSTTLSSCDNHHSRKQSGRHKQSGQGTMSPAKAPHHHGRLRRDQVSAGHSPRATCYIGLQGQPWSSSPGQQSAQRCSAFSLATRSCAFDRKARQGFRASSAAVNDGRCSEAPRRK
jgi:hypothetical protein